MARTEERHRTPDRRSRHAASEAPPGTKRTFWTMRGAVVAVIIMGLISWKGRSSKHGDHDESPEETRERAQVSPVAGTTIRRASGSRLTPERDRFPGRSRRSGRRASKAGITAAGDQRTGRGASSPGLAGGSVRGMRGLRSSRPEVRERPRHAGVRPGESRPPRGEAGLRSGRRRGRESTGSEAPMTATPGVSTSLPG